MTKTSDSKQLSIRPEPKLHAALKEEAEYDGRSMNEQVLRILRHHFFGEMGRQK